MKRSESIEGQGAYMYMKVNWGSRIVPLEQAGRILKLSSRVVP